MDKIDIWRAAHLAIQQHGERAAEFATRRITDLTMQGDQAGANVWSEILAAIAVLRLRKPPDGQLPQ